MAAPRNPPYSSARLLAATAAFIAGTGALLWLVQMFILPLLRLTPGAQI